MEQPDAMRFRQRARDLRQQMSNARRRLRAGLVHEGLQIAAVKRMLDRLARPSFDYGRISHPPSTYAQEAQKFERRLPAARRFVVERGLNEVIPGEDKDVGIILQGGLAPTALRAGSRRSNFWASCAYVDGGWLIRP